MEKNIDGLVMRLYGDLLKSVLPDGWGFALIVFKFNKDRGISNYISNAKREDMIAALEEQLKSLKRGKDFPTPNNQ